MSNDVNTRGSAHAAPHTRAPGPLYAQVADALRARLDAAFWQPGERLPPEPKLCTEFAVSSITMRRAMATLVAEGRLLRRQGSGTFVAERHHLVTASPRLSSFTEDLVQRGWSSSSRVLELTTADADARIAARLGVEPGAAVVKVHRVRIADEEPIAIQVAWVPSAVAPGLETADSLARESLYVVLRRAYGVAPAAADETFRVGVLTKGEAAQLEVAPKTPAFRVERVTVDGPGRVIEFAESVIRGDRYSIAMHLRAS